MLADSVLVCEKIQCNYTKFT